MATFVISSDRAVGTLSDDLFLLETAIDNVSVFGLGGDDIFRADLSLLRGWSTDSVEVLDFNGARDGIFTLGLGFGGRPRIADVSGTTSTVFVDMQSSGSRILGGTDTYVDAREYTEITEFDMQTGSFIGTWRSFEAVPGALTIRPLSNTYLDIKGVLGGDENDRVLGSDTNDRVGLGAGQNYFDGRDGVDKYTIIGAREDYTVEKNGDVLTVYKTSDQQNHTAELHNVERIEFIDETLNTIGELAFDQDGAAGQTYRLYKAAFDRLPDPAGLSHNVYLTDVSITIYELATAFINSEEFKQLYGDNVDDTTFVTLLYNNVLDRAPDAAGLAGWLAQLSSGEQSRHQVLFGFSESGENKAATASLTDDGIWLA